MKIIARIKMPKKLSANIGELKLPLSGGFEEGYKQGREDGYNEGEKTATERAETHNAAILKDCNAVLPTKGVETAETLEQVPEKIEQIRPYSDGYDDGHDDGKQAQYDAFWDAYQNNGATKSYDRAFGGSWTAEIFMPKYDIIANTAYMMFAGNQMEIDLPAHLADIGVSVDVSQATNTQYMFQTTRFTRIGVVDVRASTNSVPLDSAFAHNNKLITIDKIYLKTGTRGEFDSTFNNCSALENVEFEGEIANDGLNMSACKKLSKASLLSILKAFSSASTNKSATLSLTAVNNAFETSPGAADGSTSEEWTTLIATKPNWTISLA